MVFRGCFGALRFDGNCSLIEKHPDLVAAERALHLVALVDVVEMIGGALKRGVPAKFAATMLAATCALRNFAKALRTFPSVAW